MSETIAVEVPKVQVPKDEVPNFVGDPELPPIVDCDFQHPYLSDESTLVDHPCHCNDWLREKTDCEDSDCDEEEYEVPEYELLHDGKRIPCIICNPHLYFVEKA